MQSLIPQIREVLDKRFVPPKPLVDDEEMSFRASFGDTGECIHVEWGREMVQAYMFGLDRAVICHFCVYENTRDLLVMEEHVPYGMTDVLKEEIVKLNNYARFAEIEKDNE